MAQLHDGWVHLAQTDFDAMSETTPGAVPELLGPGLVAVEGVEVAWHRVPVEDFDRAWERTLARLR